MDTKALNKASLMSIEELIARHGEPLPPLSANERRELELRARLIKARLLKRTTIERQHQGPGLFLDSELPHLKAKCDV